MHRPSPFSVCLLAGAVLVPAGILRAAPAAEPIAVAAAAGAQLRLTVAQDGASLVSDRRTVTLPGGRCLVRMPSVAARLDAASIQPQFTGPGKVEVVEQRFRYDLGDSRSALKRYVGQTVQLHRPSGPALSGTLLAADETLLLETADGVLINPEGTFSVPRVEAGVALTPTLEWLVDASAPGSYSVEARYAVTGLNWHAGYRASLNAAGDRLSFRGWAHAANDSGGEYRGASVALHPGNLTADTQDFRYSAPVSLDRHSEAQLSLVAVPELPVTRELVFFPSEGGADLARAVRGAPQYSLRLRNTKEAGLGLPLPAGGLTVWGQSADGALRDLAERELPELAVGDRFTVPLRGASGIKAERIQTAVRALNPLTDEHTLSVELTSTRSDVVSVTVVERLPAGWRVSESSVPAAAQEGGLVEFRVTVPAGGKAALKYVIEVKKPDRAKPQE